MLREIFDRNPNIIINNDIDGFLSGMILQHYLGCEVVGFTNSKDKVWVIPEVQSIYDPVYIDMYVNRPDVVCIDQHVVADNQERFNRILAYGTKLNPNLQLAPRTLENNYKKKYPFGTVHYLIHLMGNENIDVVFRNLRETVHVNIGGVDYRTHPGQVLMRADDALYNTFKAYQDNSDEWWTRLNTSNGVQRIIDYKNSCNRDQIINYENHVGNLFIALGCRQNNLRPKVMAGVTTDSDGSFPNITIDEVPGRPSTIRPEIVSYVQKISEIMGIDMHIPNTFILHTAAIANRARPGTIIDHADLFSYAFVAGPRSNECFSYTINMR